MTDCEIDPRPQLRFISVDLDAQRPKLIQSL
jgi:hypothetical protein